jgi:hypothetical protein
LAFDGGLFLAAVGVCALAGPIPTLVAGSIVRGKTLKDTIIAAGKLVTKGDGSSDGEAEA